MNHFTYGLVTPAIAYVMSCVGCYLGLLCTSRARASQGGSRTAWLILAAVSIGGTGIWVMHFIAMLGFSVTGLAVRYDIPLTLLSAFIAIVIVGSGLLIVSRGRNRTGPLLIAGVLTGSGVATMHYTGMAAMRMHAEVSYDPLLFGTSIAIAIVASIVALWFTLAVRGRWVTPAAALVMGVAVTGMHYTGMAAMRIHAHPIAGSPGGAAPVDFLLPLIIGISICTVILVTVIGTSPDEEELRSESAFREELQRRRSEPPQEASWFH